MMKKNKVNIKILYDEISLSCLRTKKINIIYYYKSCREKIFKNLKQLKYFLHTSIFSAIIIFLFSKKFTLKKKIICKIVSRRRWF